MAESKYRNPTCYAKHKTYLLKILDYTDINSNQSTSSFLIPTLTPPCLHLVSLSQHTATAFVIFWPNHVALIFFLSTSHPSLCPVSLCLVISFPTLSAVGDAVRSQFFFFFASQYLLLQWGWLVVSCYLLANNVPWGQEVAGETFLTLGVLIGPVKPNITYLLCGIGTSGCLQQSL